MTAGWLDELDRPAEDANSDSATDPGHRGQLKMAYRLGETHHGRLLHVHGIGWHVWDGTRWSEDDSGAARRAVLDVLRSALLESLDKQDKELRSDVGRCETATGMDGVLTIASALEPFAATVRDLDLDPYLLNVANGTLDLRTQQLRPHDPADRITKVTRAAWRPNTASTAWTDFIAAVLPDESVRGFLQRLLGVALLGKVVEHILAIQTGTGANGKGTAYKAQMWALGDYAGTAEPDLFMHRDGAHPTGEMDLRGRRWVVVSESDKDRRLAEATMKRLTGGDLIKARRMRQDFVEFEPSHTATLITNHLPKVTGDDPAIWRRVRVIPFDVVFTSDQQDRGLDDRLRLDADAVLAWAVQGYREYTQRGLDEPEAVSVATERYQLDSDALSRFIEERCLTGQHYQCHAGQLFEAWSRWCAAEATEAGSKKAFGLSLDRKGYPDGRTATGRLRKGIALLAEEDDDD
jgi:putative DNA primase/helicase